MNAEIAPLKAPFPWFGGKSRAAHLIWPRFGNVPNYVEPFAGSLAVLLNRPHAPANDVERKRPQLYPWKGTDQLENLFKL